MADEVSLVANNGDQGARNKVITDLTNVLCLVFESGVKIHDIYASYSGGTHAILLGWDHGSLDHISVTDPPDLVFDLKTSDQVINGVGRSLERGLVIAAVSNISTAEAPDVSMHVSIGYV